MGSTAAQYRDMQSPGRGEIRPIKAMTPGFEDNQHDPELMLDYFVTN